MQFVEAVETDFLPPVERLSRDIIDACRSLRPEDIRYLVDVYYQVQEFRKAAANQKRAADESTEPHKLIAWLSGQFLTFEGQVKRALDAWTSENTVAKWAKSITGIGPVLSAGLAAHIDITRAPTVGHIWSFCGLNPNARWEKGQKRPFCLRAKVLCWKIGDSFVKFHNHPKCAYGRVYAQRKALELERNEECAFKDQAEATLAAKKIREAETRVHYEAGKLPPGRLDLRARRYAVKLFLAHWHDIAYRAHYGRPPPKPYAIAQLGHAHEITPGEMT